MISRRSFLAAALAPLGRAPAGEGSVVRAVVAADGSGEFRTIQRAVDHVLDQPPREVARVVLEIRPGVYRERVKIPQDRPHLVLSGADPASTIIRYDSSAKAAGGTFFSPVVEVDGAALEAENLTFENTFGTGSQAVALSIHSDRARFRNCRFLGWQDTLYAAGGRQHYRDCYIAGHVDFIFGAAAAVFDTCEIHSRGPGYLTAQFRTRPDEPTGFVFRNCRLTAEAGVSNVYLGRPWRAYSRAVFLDCWMGSHIRPEGWSNWGKVENEKTAWYGERGSTGPGSEAAARVSWAHPLTHEEAAAFATAAFLRGWDPAP